MNMLSRSACPKIWPLPFGRSATVRIGNQKPIHSHDDDGSCVYEDLSRDEDAAVSALIHLHPSAVSAWSAYHEQAAHAGRERFDFQEFVDLAILELPPNSRFSNPARINRDLAVDTVVTVAPSIPRVNPDVSVRMNPDSSTSASPCSLALRVAGIVSRTATCPVLKRPECVAVASNPANWVS